MLFCIVTCLLLRILLGVLVALLRLLAVLVDVLVLEIGHIALNVPEVLVGLGLRILVPLFFEEILHADL